MKTPRKQSKSSILNFSALRTPAALQQPEQQYSDEISNRFAALDENISSASIQSGYDNYRNRRQSQLSVLPKRKRQRERERKKERESTDSFSKSTDSFMFRQKETCRKFRNYRNDHNYLSYCQAAITVEDSMVNNKTN